MDVSIETNRNASGYQRIGAKVTSLDSKMLDKIVRHTMAAVDKSRAQIYEIYQASRRELENVRQDLGRVRQASVDIIDRVDELGRLERRARVTLMEVSRDRKRYSEDDIHAAYNEASQLQADLAVAREKEQNLRQQRDQLEIRLRTLSETVEKAENLVSQVGAVMGYLGNQMNGVTTRMESLEERQMFGAEIIRAQEEERKRVAREIHDGPAQYMANVVFRSEVCERLLDIDLERVRTELKELSSQVRLCLQETRKIIFDLRPMTIDDLGLAPTIRRLLDTLKERRGLITELRIMGQERRFPSLQEVGAFRLVQEALTNVEKHSEAGAVTVRLEYRHEFVSAVVEDDGIGFDMSVARNGGSFGLIGMRERAELLGGEVAINSQPGHGTKVFFKLPVRPDH